MTQTAPGAAPGPAGAAPDPWPAGDGAARWRRPRPADALRPAGRWYAGLSPRRRDVAQDTALGVGLAVLNVLSLLPYQSQLHPLWLPLLLVAGQCLPLALRRVLPVPALIGCGLIRNIYDALSYAYAPLPLGPAIAAATVAERSGRTLRWITVLGISAGLAWSQTLPGHTQPYDAIVQVFIFGAAWAVGTLSRHRRAALAAAAARAARAEAALDEAADQAATAERLRIARELHDVVAHHVSLIAVQAEAVGALLPARPAEAAASADLIGSTARAAMTELRRLLGVLRFRQNDDSDRSRLAPAPTLARLDELLDVVREAGLGVTCQVLGPVAALPPGVDLTAYRILQEALTNAVRHAPGAAAAVRVTYAPAGLTVEVANTAAAPGASPAGPPARFGPGFGLAGIAERVASCGGSLALGPVADGGFSVTARLPRT